MLFATEVDAINTLAAAQAASKLKAELKKYLSPQILILDELGYLPIDKNGADLLFQVISQRYERGSTIISRRPRENPKPADCCHNIFKVPRLLHLQATADKGVQVLSLMKGKTTTEPCPPSIPLQSDAPFNETPTVRVVSKTYSTITLQNDSCSVLDSILE